MECLGVSGFDLPPRHALGRESDRVQAPGFALFRLHHFAALDEAHEKNDRRARLAVEIFCYRARKYIGAYLAAMNGADAIVFTGGIGENSPEVRAAICEGLSWLGIEVDPERNAAHMTAREGPISADASRVAVYVIPTNEELLIARDTVRVVSGAQQRS
jgi:acetate kinase